MDREQTPGKRFRKAMFGFRKADVMNYIDWLESDTAAQLSDCREQISVLHNAQVTLEQQVQQLETEKSALLAERSQLLVQAADATERIDFLEASRLACTQRLSASERQNASLQELSSTQ